MWIKLSNNMVASVTSKANNNFQIQAFTKQLELLTRVMNDLKDDIALMKQ
jgi:hypothetical protein